MHEFVDKFICALSLKDVPVQRLVNRALLLFMLYIGSQVFTVKQPEQPILIPQAKVSTYE
jgi:hypothetical protein